MMSSELDLQIERCADGELTDADQQRLLERLDAQPEGWRRLALAYVERQVWRQACRDLARGAPQPGLLMDGADPRSAVEGRKAERRRAPFRWAAAAGLLLAMGVGISAKYWSDRRPSEGSPLVETRSPRPHQFVARSTELLEPPPEVARPWTTLAGLRSEFPGDPAAAALAEPAVMLELPLGRSGEEVESVEIPVFHADDYFSRWPDASASLLTPEQRRLFEQEGYYVRRSQHFVPVTLEGGGSVLLPVETIDVQDNVY